MQREDVERLADGMEREIRRVTGIDDLQSEEAEALRALLAERDAAYAAGQREMRKRAVKEVIDNQDCDPWEISGRIYALPIKPRPD